ncbi:alkyl sulfatase C-terminal domain-containing protein [Saccharopolyspora shandongensis]
MLLPSPIAIEAGEVELDGDATVLPVFVSLLDSPNPNFRIVLP